MTDKIEDLTVEYVDENNFKLSEELDKKILTKGAWSTIIFKYHDWNNQKQEYGADKFTIRRYQKLNNEYKQKSKFNISSKDQAQKIIDALCSWIGK